MGSYVTIRSQSLKDYLLVWIPIGVDRNMLELDNGKIPIISFKSSTCSTVHSLHGFSINPSDPRSPSVIRAARLKNLHGLQWKYVMMGSEVILCCSGRG
ncbi:hypothetical protein VNO78_14180 [Psophocarpus tetragonolobus]|uniref:Uncharacterized protein n=1 Tax=Psophocarpus tetragonolobus TaxID=3891 RepID=A0AAN9SZN8_PSOTE